MAQPRYSIRDISKLALWIAEHGGESDETVEAVDAVLKPLKRGELVDVIFALAGQVHAIVMMSPAVDEDPEAYAEVFRMWREGMDNVVAPDDPEMN